MLRLSILAFALGILLPGLVWPTEVESGTGANTIVIEPEDFGWPSLSGAFYNGTGIQVGTDFYLYVQTNLPDEGPGSPCFGDQIVLFKAPWTSPGLRSQFEWVSDTEVVGEGVVGRVSPCFSTDHNFGVGGVFRSASGPYVLMADKSNDTADVFREILIGTSPDGKSWEWAPFVESVGDYSILDVTLVSSDLISVICDSVGCFNHVNWWGFFRFGFGDNGADRVGRMRVDYSDRHPRGFRVFILSGGVWKSVDDLTGQYSFQPDDVWPASGGQFFAPNAIVDNEGVFELWANTHNVSGCGCSFGNGSTFLYREVTDDTMGPVQSVFSDLRCMPSDNGVGRMFPFVLKDMDGKRLLYSTSNDKNCGSIDPNNPFLGMYVLVTEFK